MAKAMWLVSNIIYFQKMISIQAYRIAIGCFLGKAQFFTSMSKNQKVLNIARTRRKNISYKSGSLETWTKTIIIMPRLCISMLLLGLGLRSFNALIIDGDVESNLGRTYFIENAICGSYHQGNRQFDDTAGVQCSSLYALCWSQIKKVGFWDRLDLDHVLTEGDSLYKTLNTFDILSVYNLPRFIRV